MEIELFDEELKSEGTQLPCIRLSKFVYDNETMQSWGKGCSPSNHWRFYYPLRNADLMNIELKDGYSRITPINQESSDRHYWGVRHISSKQIPLMDVTADNVEEKIFKTFDSL